MVLSLLLIILATLCATTAVYGTHPNWAIYPSGMEIIQTVRRLQWPLFTASVLFSVALLGLVISGRRRFWWLLALVPVLALFLQAFLTGTRGTFRVIEEPPMLEARSSQGVGEDEWVVGLIFADQPYAFPYRQLYHAPAVLLQKRDRRMLLMWSAFANRAMAFQVSRQIRGRELDIVSMPANALLLYNARIGEFINGLTGLTPQLQKPRGFGEQLPTIKTTWSRWKALHPDTLISDLATLPGVPPGPVRPQFPMAWDSRADPQAEALVIVFAGAPPVAIPQSAVRDELLNTTLDDKPVMIFRDPRTHQVRAFYRMYLDYVPRFVINTSPQKAQKGVAFIDLDTNSGWSLDGVAIDGDKQMIGARLTPLTSFEEGLYWGVMKHWYPDLLWMDIR